MNLDAKPFGVPVHVEFDKSDAKTLFRHFCRLVGEGLLVFAALHIVLSFKGQATLVFDYWYSLPALILAFYVIGLLANAVIYLYHKL